MKGSEECGNVTELAADGLAEDGEILFDADGGADEWESKIEGAGGHVHNKIKKDTHCLVVSGVLDNKEVHMRKARGGDLSSSGSSAGEMLKCSLSSLDLLTNANPQQSLKPLCSMGSSPAKENEGVIGEVPGIILRCVSRDEAALAVAQKVFKGLYENASNSTHVAAHLAILAAIRDVSKLVLKELTSWVIYSDEDRKFNKDITIGLIHNELLNLAEYNVHMAKLIDAGRNSMYK
ncbi:hypothetical protein LOK49_LG01G00708 [Camellia lanceoleosa]|uniref:Uncharacterized protein n=1 Tax=Camellia lanceoleosa TaxID=1840588 RepID=A0ACC0IYA5_9ERIC|nr:hypothetical protein LOK49_LG01G00708 [Camellia lanceoleosa]